MTRRGPRGVPANVLSDVEMYYLYWRNKLHPDAPAFDVREEAYLKAAVTHTYFTDGEGGLHFVAREVLDEWAAAWDSPSKQRALKATDFKIQ